jgi:hypothetical protein
MSTVEALLVATHLAVTAAMVGLIWFVQVVHYPLFTRVGSDGFAAYERAHQQRTAYVVGPFMGLEGVLALVLAADPPGDVGRALPLVGLALLGIVQASTVLLQVPAHGRLGGGFDPGAARRLVRTNWVRTAGWSARGVVAVALVAVAAT